MQLGKIPENILTRSVLKNITVAHPDVLVHAGMGVDAATLKTEGEHLVLATNSLTGNVKELGNRAFLSVANDIAVSGGKLIGVLVNILLPTSTQEKRLKKIMKDLNRQCQEAGVEILGGHTEVTHGVNQPLLTITGVGKVREEDFLKPGQMKPGQDIVVTKWIGLEGTALLAKEKEEELAKELPHGMIETAQSFEEMEDVFPECQIAREIGVSAMHNASQGGIFGALWEIASASDVGMEVDLKKIPIRQETIEVCEVFDVNPYLLKSQGALVLATEDGKRMVEALEKHGISSEIVGVVTEGNDRVVMNGEERRFLEPPRTDEWFRIHDK